MTMPEIKIEVIGDKSYINIDSELIGVVSDNGIARMIKYSPKMLLSLIEIAISEDHIVTEEHIKLIESVTGNKWSDTKELFRVGGGK